MSLENIQEHKFKRYQKGEFNPNWKGGKKIQNGYIKILIYDENGKRKYKPEHRLIYEEYYKCCLLDWVHIHHKNGNKSDNRIENLKPIYHNNHTSLHNIGNKYGKNKKIDMSDRKCLLCNSKKTRIQYNYKKWYKYQNGYICHKCYMWLIQ